MCLHGNVLCSVDNLGRIKQLVATRRLGVVTAYHVSSCTLSASYLAVSVHVYMLHTQHPDRYKLAVVLA